MSGGMGPSPRGGRSRIGGSFLSMKDTQSDSFLTSQPTEYWGARRELWTKIGLPTLFTVTGPWVYPLGM